MNGTQAQLEYYIQVEQEPVREKFNSLRALCQSSKCHAKVLIIQCTVMI